ncbi:MAG: asparagine synthase-related protein [Candidatus Woesearchaeota archaeon]
MKITNLTTFDIIKYEILEREGNVYLKRDWIGLIPLHYSIRQGEILVANTIKALMKQGIAISDIQTVRSGCIDKIHEDGNVDTETYYQLPEVTIQDEPEIASRRLRESLDNSGALEGATAVMLSGGMDSTIAAYLAKKFNPDIECYCLSTKKGDSDNLDQPYARQVAQLLGLPLIELTIHDSVILEVLDQVVFACEDYRDYNVFSAVGAFILGKRILQDGHRKIICGEGPDEIFGSYEPWGSHSTIADEARKPEMRRKFVKRLEWNLSRGTKVFEFISPDISLVSPYLTREFVEYGVNLAPETVNIHKHRKGILADAFANVLPIDMLLRGKVRFQDGSGVTQVLKENGVDNQYLKRVFDRHFR